MEHRKEEHPQNISDCRENKNGLCRFSEIKCWYKHEKVDIQNEIKSTENPEIIKRLFNMMEKFAATIELLENITGCPDIDID